MAKFQASTLNAYSRLGASVAIDGDRAIAGAPSTTAFGGSPGQAFVFERNASGTWQQVLELGAPSPRGQDEFGEGVALEGERVVVTAPNKGTGGSGPGAAYVFDRQANGTWPLTMTLQHTSPQFSGDGLGWIGEIGLQGGRTVIGNPLSDLSGTDQAGAVYVFDLGTLYHGAPEVSAASGGIQNLYLRAGTAHAGELFLILGSLSGTSPGLPIPGTTLTLPLNYDPYTGLLFSSSGAGFVTPFSGTLDAQGEANSLLAIPAGTNPVHVGKAFHHAFVSIDVVGSLQVESVSNPVKATIVP